MADQNFFPVPRWCLFSSTSSTSGALVPRSFFCTMKVAMSAAFTNNKKHMYTLLQNHYIIINIGDVWKNDRFVSKFDSRSVSPTLAFSMTLANSPTHWMTLSGVTRMQQSPLLMDAADGSTSLTWTLRRPLTWINIRSLQGSRREGIPDPESALRRATLAKFSLLANPARAASANPALSATEQKQQAQMSCHNQLEKMLISQS